MKQYTRIIRRCALAAVIVQDQLGNRPVMHHGIIWRSMLLELYTRSSADADNRLDALSGQSRSTNMVLFHMLHIVSYCAIVTLSLRFFTIFVFKKFHDLEMGVKGHSRSLRVVSFDRLCMVSY